MTEDQQRAIESLGDGAGVRPAAVGHDVFAYYDREGSTVRYQVGPGGEVVDRRRFERMRSKGSARRSGSLALERR
jgi:hypothetical protein